MKTVALILSLASIAIAQEKAVPMKKITPMQARTGTSINPEATLLPGATVTTEVFQKLEWIQGEGPKEWEPGKLYILECWATWCGPCIAAIPHVNELHQKYHEKGLRVYGIDVWEDGKEKVESFVKKKGDGMSYPVAYTGKGGAFETEWLKPAAVGGIPHTFVVRDGKLLLNVHPSSLTDEIIEALLSGEEGVKTAIAKLDEAKARSAKYSEAMRGFATASRGKDAESMAARLAEMKELGGSDPRITAFEIELAVAKKDWAGASKLFAEIPEFPMKMITIQQAAGAVEGSPDAPEELLRLAATAYAPVVEKVGGPVDFQKLAGLQWRLGEKPTAITTMKSAREKAASETYARVGFNAEPYDKIVASMEKGVLPDEETSTAWFREAAQKRRPESPKPTGS